jgi:zinc D-Ala-D-Ala carboxypeptidase
MLNGKKIKSLIVISLLLIEAFVWTANGSNNFWSLGIIGGADGPTTIIVGDGGDKTDDGTPSAGGNPDQNNGGQSDQNIGEQDGQTDQEGYPPADNPNREQALKEAWNKGLLILVNKEHPVDADYKPDDLTEIKAYVPDRSETTRYMRAEAANAFGMLVDKAAADGAEIKMTTAYRSYDFQKILFDNSVAKEGEEKANTYSAKPGQSEHQTGLAVDVSSPSVDYQLSNDYGKTSEGKWIVDHAYRFGFILRFPKGKEDITGYQYEPWHLRYVGLTAAKEIHEQNLTLEEYLQANEIE